MATVAFIGLGVMGAPMAGHLASAGHAVRVYNRKRKLTDFCKTKTIRWKVALPG